MFFDATPGAETLKAGTIWISSPGVDKHLMSEQTLRQSCDAWVPTVLIQVVFSSDMWLKSPENNPLL